MNKKRVFCAVSWDMIVSFSDVLKGLCHKVKVEKIVLGIFIPLKKTIYL